MLGNVPAKSLCGGCNTPNVIDSMDNIKVMFSLNSDVLYVLAENYACTPSKESMSHTSVFALPTQQDQDIHILLGQEKKHKLRLNWKLENIECTAQWPKRTITW